MTSKWPANKKGALHSRTPLFKNSNDTMTERTSPLMNEDNYIKDRLDAQISWYDKKSVDAQKAFKRIKKAEIGISLSITLLGTYTAVTFTIPWTQVQITIGLVIVLLGSILSFLHFYQSLEKYHENWISYRQTCELLKHEKYLFLTRSGGYVSAYDPFKELVERCESIISSENVDWAQLHTNTQVCINAHSSTGS